MRYLFAVFLLVLLSACSSIPPIGGAPAVGPNPVGLLAPAPTATATVTPSQLGAALRPEDQGDLPLVQSPTLYELNIDVDPSLQRLKGFESVTYTNRETVPLNEIYFRLFPNYPDGGDKLDVTSVQVNGTPVSPTLEVQDTALRVPLGSPLAPGSRVSLRLDYALTIPLSSTVHYADFTNTDGIVTLPSSYPLIPAYDAKGWHIELPPPYGDLVYADTSLYDVRVTAPTTTTVVASGSTIEASQQGNATTWHMVGAPMRDFDINLSAVLQKSSAQVGDVTVNSYYLPADERGGKQVLQWATDAMQVYQKRIGPYPFKELDVVESPTQAGGIEYPGLVVIASSLYGRQGQQANFEFPVVHEVAHQWWYAQVGDDQVNTPWMDESLTQYTAYIYFQDVHGQAAASELRNRYFDALYTRAKDTGKDLPIGLPVASYDEEQYGEIVYGKGPLFFDTVRQQIGDEAFFKFLQTYYERYKYQVATPDDLLRTIEEVSGKNIDALYNHWVLGK